MVFRIVSAIVYLNATLDDDDNNNVECLSEEVYVYSKKIHFILKNFLYCRDFNLLTVTNRALCVSLIFRSDAGAAEAADRVETTQARTFA